MLFRCSDGKIIDIKIQSFITDKDYYDILLKISKNSFLSLIIKIGIVGLYLYVFTNVYKSLGVIFNTKGLFLDPSMAKVKLFFILYCLFELIILILVFYIFYTIFK